MGENPLTEEEFIRTAQLDWEDTPIYNLEDALEACYMNGNYDDIGGDVEAPTGHFYLCERWILVTDSAGNKDIRTFESTEEAEAQIIELQQEFDLWNEPN